MSFPPVYILILSRKTLLVLSLELSLEANWSPLKGNASGLRPISGLTVDQLFGIRLLKILKMSDVYLYM